MHTRAILILMVFGLCALAVAQPGTAPGDDVLQAVGTALRTTDAGAAADNVWRVCIERHGTIDPLLRWLPGQADDAATSEEKVALLRLHAALCRRIGDLNQAQASLAKIPAGQLTTADALSVAETRDALGDTDGALKAYEALLKDELDPTLRNRIILRTALMRPGRSALAAAAADWTPELRNQAAIILALQNKQKDAIRLFQVSGEGTKRFQQQVRLAEWAIESKQYGEAQKFAWDAAGSAKMRRDRRYALAVLVEAYRRAGSLDGLIEQFANTEQLDDDTRLIWIDLLRETGKVDEALRLFRGSTDGTTFTNDMRRQLLELCRETGREKTLVEAYTKLIENQPRLIEWREGLSRFYLERGDRAAAVATWTSHLQLVQETRPRMGAAASLMKLGLDDLAEETARSCVGRSDIATNIAQLFLFELHHSRGRAEDARRALTEIEDVVTPDAAVRLEVSDAYERLGDKAEAVRVLQSLKDARGERSGIDADIKLAFLCSEIGEEKRAQDLWLELWGRVESIPRRKFVEERVMTVAARLGTLAGIAVDLETRLAEGKASDREAGMLISLYTRVNDAVSATEIVEEHLKKKGRDSVEVLTEKARLYHSCNDYFNYEKTIRNLIEIDDAGRPDHLRELAMSLLEKGQRRDARLVLEQLKQVEGASTTSDEFEAGVLSLAGMHVEAMHAYYRSLARHPERIDTYLLLANTLMQLGERDRAQGMFQHLAAAPVQDDLFTIAVDGVLNLQGPRRQPAPSPLLAWTRRMALERVAMRPHKLYLYQLVTDLSDEHGDPGMARRALSAALPIAGEQRTPLLRELMERTRTNNNGRPRVLGIVNVAGRSSSKPSNEHLMLGRRLLGQGELVPPGVYLDLGAAFLAGGEVVNASRTFSAASRLPEFDDLQGKIAGAFETAGYAKEALRTYERILTIDSRNVKLLAKVGELHERMGRDEIALGLFERGLGVLLAQRPFTQTTEGPIGAPSLLMRPFVLSRSRSTDEGMLAYPRLLSGLLATLPGGDGCAQLLDRQEREIDDELVRLASDAPDDPRMGRYPRLALRTAVYRRLATSFGLIARADAVDARLLAAMPTDTKLLDEVLRFRLAWGLLGSAKELLANSGASAEARRRHGLQLATVDPGQISGLIPVSRAAPLVLPLLARGDDTGLRNLMERVDLSNAGGEDLKHLPVLINASLCLGDDELCLNLMRFWADTAFGQIRNPAKLNIAFTQLMKQSNEIRILSASQRQNLIVRIVDRIAADPDRFSTIIRRLWTLMTPGDGMIEAKQVERLIRTALSSADRLAHGVPELFGFIPAEQRDTLLRSVFPLLAASQRGYFVANYVRLYDISDSKQVRAFILQSFEQGLRDADNPLVVTSAANRLIRELRPKNIDLIFSMLDIVEKRQPDKKIKFNVISRAMQSSGLATDTEEAWGAFVAIWNKYANRADVTMANAKALERMLKPFVSKRHEALKVLVAGLENESRRKAALAVLQLGKPPTIKVAATLEELRRRVEDQPDDVAVLSQLERMLSAKGYWVEAVRIQERIVKARPTTAAKAALSKMWSFLRHPIKALAADPSAPDRARPRVRRAPRGIIGLPMRTGTTFSMRTGTTTMTTILGGVAARGPALPRITEAKVKKAIKGKDEDEARKLYRGFWRQNANSNILRQSFATSTLLRPKAASTPASIAQARGGLSPDYDARAAFLDWKPDEWKPRAPNLRKLPFIVAKTAWGMDELSRQLRSVDPQRLRQADSEMLLRAIVTQMVESGGKEAIDPILARHESGLASTTDYAMLFMALETLKERPDGVTEELLDAVLKNVGSDAGQVRRLAGLFVRFGFPAKASALYRWCACDPGAADPRTGIVRGRRDHADLLGEVLSRLSGEHRAKTVATILRGSRFPQHDRLGMDNFESQTLGMLVALDGAASALAQSRGLVNSLFDLGTSPRRETAVRAAGLLARDGAHERALDLLEIGIASHPVPPGTRPHERRYWEQARPMKIDDFQWLFAKDKSDWKDAAGWYEAVAKRLLEWRADERLAANAPLHVLALITKRLGAVGRPAPAALVAAVEQGASHTINDRVILADVLRAAGRADDALIIERELLQAGRLHPERTPAVVAHVLDQSGAQAALELGEGLTEYTLHPDLLDVLIRAARQLGDAPRAARYEEKKALAALAQRKLDGAEKDG